MSVGEHEVIDRVINVAPDTLIAREKLGGVEADYTSSKSVFDTELSAEADYTRDEFQRSSDFFGTREDTANWNIGLGKKLPFGTSAAFEWTNQRTRLFGLPTIAGASIFPTAPTYESAIQFSVSQPLMKNFAGMNDRGTVAQAAKAFSAADLGTRYQIASIASYALYLYWQWVLSYAYMASWSEIIADSQHFLNITLERERLGVAEETDVLAARANLLNRRNGLLRARRNSIQIEKDLKILLGYAEDEQIKPRDKMPQYIHDLITDEGEAISMALANRWDYLAQKDEIERLNIQLVNAKNKRWPELDVIGTIASNGLDSQYSSSLNQVNHPQWAIGMQFSIPLENRYARGEFKKAGHEKTKAVIGLKKMENEISNTISELLRRLRLNEKVLANAQSAERLQREKLKEEMKKYGMGRSSSELIILYQDDQMWSEVSTLDAWANYIKTVLDLKLQENVLIDL